jgi:hypothetical protein
MESFLQSLQSRIIPNKVGGCGYYATAIATAYYMFITNHPKQLAFFEQLKNLDDVRDAHGMTLSDLPITTRPGSYNVDYILIDMPTPIVDNAKQLVKINYQNRHWWSSCPENRINFYSKNYNNSGHDKTPICWGGLYERINKSSPITVVLTKP